ncbi:tubulin-specific chaperone-like protein c [Calycina marina]|uniref:Tubulin-specific chaperone-like protein c n=1 Tax=Calycina marina TaxID=1763456 RepID=A0A9P7Z0U2_9HELO|nr:tubulin-specific chaperone-like protein c [Calycina marina]
MASTTPRATFNHDAVAGNKTPDAKERFYRYFQEEQIAQLESFSLIGGERQDATEHCLAGIQKLSNDAVKALVEKLQTTRSKMRNKSRFQFKPTTAKNKSAISLSDAAELVAQSQAADRARFPTSNEASMATTPAEETRDMIGELPSFLPKNYNAEMGQPGNAIRKPSFSQATAVNISDHTGIHIILPSSASRATTSGSITQMKRCIVDMSVPTTNGAPFAGLALKDIKESLIIAGHVAGAAHITAVENSVIVVASRQVRIHDCKNVDIYLECSSRPIIEDCENIRFSPIPDLHNIMAEAATNQWDQVDDFKWLKAEHSPNWSILPEAEILAEPVWSKVVPGGPGIGLEDILKKVGIARR